MEHLFIEINQVINRKLKCEPCELSIDGSSYEEADGSTVTPDLAPATDVNSCGLSDDQYSYLIVIVLQDK